MGTARYNGNSALPRAWELFRICGIIPNLRHSALQQAQCVTMGKARYNGHSALPRAWELFRNCGIIPNL
ncbi:unnamed protein product, partial [Mesorhabditis belari]|uniref:Uncharacterized protein n=1 Tax=Mesorhabditis belari TaxID=2138241 RepID=A0AAF3J571_9BILA